MLPYRPRTGTDRAQIKFPAHPPWPYWFSNPYLVLFVLPLRVSECPAFVNHSVSCISRSQITLPLMEFARVRKLVSVHPVAGGGSRIDPRSAILHLRRFRSPFP